MRWWQAMVVLLLFSALALAGCSRSAPGATPAASPAPAQALKKIHWNVSVHGGPRVLTFPVADWAQDMQQMTNGLWEIEIHYGEVLAKQADVLDGLRSGTFQAGLWSAGINPGKTPLHTAMDLPFIAPPDIVSQGRWEFAVGKHPALVKELDQWNAQSLFYAAIGNDQLSTKKPVKKVEDLKGMRIRARAEIGNVYQHFGAVAEMVPPAEVYTALERGMFDAVSVAVWYSLGSYRYIDFCKYATVDVDAGMATIDFAVSKDAWNALPKEWQQKATWWAETKAVNLYNQHNAVADAEWLPKLNDAGLQVIKFPPEEKAKLVAQANPVWEDWVKRMEGKGLPGRQVLDFALAEKEKLRAEAGKKK